MVRAKPSLIVRGFKQRKDIDSFRDFCPNGVGVFFSFVGCYWVLVCVIPTPSKRLSSRMWKRIFCATT